MPVALNCTAAGSISRTTLPEVLGRPTANSDKRRLPRKGNAVTLQVGQIQPMTTAGSDMSESSNQLLVYVVEDSPVMLRMLASTIEAAGAVMVGHSESAQRAINEIFVLEPDLILIDISLNRGNGFDVLRLLRYRGLAKSARKVVLTNHADAEYKALSFRLGADQFYDKSFDMLKVLEMIRAMAIDHVASTHIPARSRSESHRRP